MTLDDSELKTRIARLFYDHRLTKTEIGKKLRVSRFKVARYLDEALEEGLVDNTHLFDGFSSNAAL